MLCLLGLDVNINLGISMTYQVGFLVGYLVFYPLRLDEFLLKGSNSAASPHLSAWGLGFFMALGKNWGRYL